MCMHVMHVQVLPACVCVHARMLDCVASVTVTTRPQDLAAVSSDPGRFLRLLATPEPKCSEHRSRTVRSACMVTAAGGDAAALQAAGDRHGEEEEGQL